MAEEESSKKSQRYSKTAKFAAACDKLKFWRLFKRKQKKRPQIGDGDKNLESERMRLAAEIEANIAKAEAEANEPPSKTPCGKRKDIVKAQRR